MIISRTPLRISFVGGGSDLASFYKQSYGAVVSTAIDKYIYITVNQKFDNKIRVSYSKTEMVDKVGELKHELVREALKVLKIKGGVEITSISDIPSSGTGLGSSSAYTVGVLNALRAYLHKVSSPDYLAEKACEIEIERCGQPIGKQDQYAISFGGFNYIRFNPDGSVVVEPITCSPKTKRNLEANLLMLYTGLTRSSSSILSEQKINTVRDPQNQLVLQQMVQLAEKMRVSLVEGKLKEFGRLLDMNWRLKKTLARGISTSKIDRWYKIAQSKGALGGKILGAGGGGFLLLYAPKKYHADIIKALPKLRPLEFSFEPSGSSIIFIHE